MHVQQRSLLLILTLFQATACSGSFIIGGREVKKPKPWMASVQSNNSHICGGTLIHQQWVLTAAHCKTFLQFKPIEVLLGAHSLTKDKNAMRVKVLCFHISPKFSATTRVHDIMLLKLQDKVQLKKNKVDVKKIPKSGKDIPAGTKCEVRGWGTTHVKNPKACDTLQELEVTVVDRELCNCYYNSKPTITANMLCAGNKQRDKDACWGDSGGPLECKKNIVGVVSGGSGCGNPKKPGVYTLLSKEHIDWINKIIKK
ncbi:granzyme K precursor [Ictalurus punctatus]|uniref:Granzyme n=1 Tax=Ictalurus punctatus TaxID=7998 RepID=Q6WGR1_ICTPU|nr:granzyme K precursor [Ictalurus punctatus]AAQ54830.1 granzyme [Ictalurus punctatus]